MAKIGVNGELIGGESEMGSARKGHAPYFVTQDMSTEPIEVSVGIPCDSQSVNRLYWSTHKYPKMAGVKWARGVSRHWILGLF